MIGPIGAERERMSWDSRFYHPGSKNRRPWERREEAWCHAPAQTAAPTSTKLRRRLRPFRLAQHAEHCCGVASAAPPDQSVAAEHSVRAALVDVRTDRLSRIAAMIEAGSPTAWVGAVPPLAAATVAHEMLEGNRARQRGKIPLRMAEWAGRVNRTGRYRRPLWWPTCAARRAPSRLAPASSMSRRHCRRCPGRAPRPPQLPGRGRARSPGGGRGEGRRAERGRRPRRDARDSERCCHYPSVEF
jgi:hypothetical protein